MSLRSMLLGAAPFAHLVGIAPPKATGAAPTPAPSAKPGAAKPAAAGQKAEDDEDMSKAKAEDDEGGEDDGGGDDSDDEEAKAKARKAKAKKLREQAKKLRDRARKLENGEDDEDPDGDGDDDEDGEDPDRDEDEDGGDETDREDMQRKGSKAARLRERSRCAAIFADAAAGANPALAATLAFTTSLPRSEALAVLRSGGVAAGKRGGIDERMSTAPATDVGANGGPHTGSAEDLVARINAAAAKAGGN